MSRSIMSRAFSIFVVASLFIGLIQAGGAEAYRPGATLELKDSSGKIEVLVMEEIEANGTTDFFVWMTEKADLSPADKIKTKLEKGRFVFNALYTTAERTQKDLRALLDDVGVDYQAFYIANKILVLGGNESLLTVLATRTDVAEITANHKYQLDEPVKQRPAAESATAVEPNLTFINADDVWAMGINGAGTVMAGNDTGLDETHPAIAPHYRGCIDPPACTTWDHNYNWWDATNTYPNNPADGFGHGTHTTGTMVGDDFGGNQIGVAPGAQTIHCKNMTDGGSGDDGTFTECFQWDLAPWDLSGANPNPAMAPDAVNNSWGYWDGNAPQFKDEIQALHAAGILVEVSAGNEGSSCWSLRSPGDYWEVLTTGSVNHASPFPGTITGFSSRGPSDIDGNYFPDIMAPGENVRSAVPGNGYEYWDGTSMAGPHATALVGLIWQACPSLRGMVYPTIDYIHQAAAPLTGQFGSNCGGDYTEGPNNDWGMGTIDALATVQLVVGACVGVGWLDGTVTDDTTSLPIEGALVQADWDGGFSWVDTTDTAGYYTMTVPGGTYTVTASAFGYLPGLVTDITVETETITTQNFELIPATQYVVSGTVTDAVSGEPLFATISVVSTPLDPVTTDPGTGFYSISIPEGTYTLRASAYVHQAEEREIVVDQNQIQDFALHPLPCVLLVDDDQDDPDVGDYYTQALDNIGVEYNIWDTSVDGDPTFGDLEGYQKVIWFTGYPWSGSFTSMNEEAVAAYLDSGGNFLLSSQDYLYEFGLTIFGEEYLHIGSYQSDINQTTVTGENIFSGLGPYSLSYPFTNYSDIVNPDAEALLAFDGNVGDAGISFESETFNTVFLGFPLEAVPLAGREAILERALEFFGPCGCVPVSIETLDSDSPVYLGEVMNFTSVVLGTEPITYTWDFGGAGTPGGTIENPTFLYDNVGDYTVTLDVANACPSSDSESIPVSVEPWPPEAIWTKEIWLNGIGPFIPDEIPFEVMPGDEVVIADQMLVTSTLAINFWLEEAWQVGLDLTAWEASEGIVVTDTNVLTWEVSGGTPETWYVITKTFEVQEGDWVNSNLHETLNVGGMVEQPAPIEVTFERLPADIVAPEAVETSLLQGATITMVVDIENVGGSDLDWQISVTPTATWLIVDPLMGSTLSGEVTQVVLTFDATLLEAGVYTTTLEITSNDPDNPLVIVPVQLTVEEGVLLVTLPLVVKH